MQIGNGIFSIFGLLASTPAANFFYKKVEHRNLPTLTALLRVSHVIFFEILDKFSGIIRFSRKFS